MLLPLWTSTHIVYSHMYFQFFFTLKMWKMLDFQEIKFRRVIYLPGSCDDMFWVQKIWRQRQVFWIWQQRAEFVQKKDKNRKLVKRPNKFYPMTFSTLMKWSKCNKTHLFFHKVLWVLTNIYVMYKIPDYRGYFCCRIISFLFKSVLEPVPRNN